MLQAACASMKALTLCVVALSLQVATADAVDCGSTQRFPYSPPHLATQWKQFKAELAPPEQNVIVAVLRGESKVNGILGDGVDDRTLYFALPGGVLTLWFGQAGSPAGEFPPSPTRCGSITSECRLAYSVLGSPNIWYFPSRLGGPVGSAQQGVHWYQIVTDYLRPMDRVALAAYAKYQVQSPLSKGIEYFEGSC
jgi:hypothetical protein